jgi:hypothetical protein
MRRALSRLVAQLAKTAAGPSLDLERFQDPLAKTAEWTPLVAGGASFGTHRLKEAGMHRREMRPTYGALAFYGVFLAVGLGVMAVGIGVLVASRADGLPPFLFLSLFGLVFAAVGGGMLYGGTQPIVFDLQLGYFWKGRNPPPYAFGAVPKEATSVTQIHALQIVSERCSGSKSSFTSYELNLVLQDGTRQNVVDHGNLDGLRADARELATFLVVPLWDAVT